MHAFTTALLITLLYASATEESNFTLLNQQNTFGDPECPCLTNGVHLSTPKISNGTCLGALIRPDFRKFRLSHCYPLSYGTMCDAHDRNIGPFCNDTTNRPDFCDARFCYIDPTKCKDSANHTFAQSDYFPNLYYSYTTCGEDDQLRKFTIAKRMEGVTLRIGIPQLEYPFNFRLDADGKPILDNPDINAGVGDLKGVYSNSIRAIADQAKFNIEYKAVSAGAIIRNDGNRWSGCVDDVGRGLLDMCSGDFWETMERRKMTQFSSTLFREHFYLRVPLPKVDERLGVDIVKLFQPFTITLWCTIIVATIGVGLSYMILNPGKRTSNVGVLKKIVGYLYVATMEFFQGPGSEEANGIARKGMTLTWALFILITVTAYTANLAAFLGQIKPLFQITSVNDCIAQSCKMCIEDNTVLKEKLLRKYPSLMLDSNFTSGEDVTEALAKGTCDAAIQSQFEIAVATNFVAKCKTKFIGNSILTFEVALPMSDLIAESFNYWIGFAVDEGIFDTIIRRYLPPPICSDENKVSETSTPTVQINVASMAGPLILLGVGICFGFVHSFGRRFLKETEEENLGEIDISLEGNK